MASEGKKTNFKTTFRRFGETTSIKGIGRLLKSRSIFVRVMWFLAVIIGTIIATYQITLLLKGYFSNNITAETIEVYESPDFPDVTLCNLNPLSVSEVNGMSMPLFFDEIDKVLHSDQLKSLLHYPKDQVDRLAIPQIVSSSGFFQNVNMKNQSVSSLEKFILSCSLFDWQWKDILTENSCRSYISMFFSPEYYMCFRIQISITHQQLIRGMALVLYLNDISKYTFKYMNIDLLNSKASGVRVNIHPRDSLPDSKDGVNVPPGHETNIMLQARRRTKLGAPYGLCENRDILADSNGTYIYTLSACNSLCFQDQVVNNCGCTAAHILNLPYARANIQYCGKLEKLIKMESNLTADQIAEYFLDEFEYYDYFDDNINGASGDGDMTGQSRPPPEKVMKTKTVSTLNLSPEDVATVLDKIMCSVTTKLDPDVCDCPQSCQFMHYGKSISQAPWPHPSYQLAFYEHYINGTDIDDDLDLKTGFLEYQVKAQGQRAKDEELLDMALIKDNFLQLNIFFEEKMNLEVIDKPAINISVLLATIGGALNLWIGITIMTLVELFELLYNLFVLACSCGVLPPKKVSPSNEEQEQRSNALTVVETIKTNNAF